VSWFSSNPRLYGVSARDNDALNIPCSFIVTHHSKLSVVITSQLVIYAPTGIGKTRTALSRLMKDGEDILWVNKTVENCYSVYDEAWNVTKVSSN
jgi:hypothetical protein